MAIFKGKRIILLIYFQREQYYFVNSVRLLALLLTQIPCHPEIEAKDVEVCFISMCITKGFAVWKMINLTRST